MRLTQRLWAVAVAGALTLTLSSDALAQKGKKAGPRGAVPQVFLNKLQLTAEQKTKIDAATAEFDKASEAAKALTTPKEKRQATKRARDTYEGAVHSALTPDQQKSLLAMQQEAAQYAGMGPIGNQMVGLNLTDDQKGKIKEIQGKYQPELEKLKAEQKGASDKKPIAAQIKDVNAKMTQEVKAVLTPDQLKLLPGGKKKQQ
jgi:Spy/CpxP family protein refolding chaperone